MALKLITGPTTDPITLEEAKLHLRVDHDEENSLIQSIISAARELCEGFQRRSIAEQTWELTLDFFPSVIRIPMPPLQSVESVTYKDKDGLVITLDPANYIVDNDKEPGIIIPAYGKTWPTFTPYPSGAVKVRFQAGYTPETVPAKVKQAMLLLIGEWYENRENVVVGNVNATELPFAVKALLSMDRVW